MAFGIPESAIEEIKARTDLSDLIAGYGIQVKRAGGSYKACCPFHHEKTPSFHIQPEKDLTPRPCCLLSRKDTNLKAKYNVYIRNYFFSYTSFIKP